MSNASTPAIAEISVEELSQRLAQLNSSQFNLPPSKYELQLIDVREPEELELAHIDGFVNLPLSQFAAWSGQIHSQFNPDTETIVLCHHGVRSAQMCQWLYQQGFTQLKNVTGGIESYSVFIDPTIPRY